MWIIILCLVTLALSLLSNKVAADRARAYNNTRPVDTVHELFEPCNGHLADAAVFFPFILVLLGRFNLPYIVSAYCILMLVKVLLVQCTILPTLEPGCERPLLCPGGNCNDYIYSGHTLVVALSCYVLWVNGILSTALAAAYVGITILLIAAARNHYFVDTILALAAVWILTREYPCC